MTDHDIVARELRLLIEYGELDQGTINEAAERILEALSDNRKRTVSLIDALDQAGVHYTRVKMTTDEA